LLIKKEESKKKEKVNSCVVWEYPFTSKKLGIATALIDGRYPEKGKALNSKSDLVCFVISGNGVIHNDEGK